MHFLTPLGLSGIFASGYQIIKSKRAMGLVIYIIMVLLEVNWQIDVGRRCRQLRKTQSAKVQSNECEHMIQYLLAMFCFL